jgi:hypothetical protein
MGPFRGDAMLKRTRVSPVPDMQRLATALSRPGIDPRIWVSLAIVRGVQVDPVHGVFVNVLLMPTQVPVTARLGAEYAGAGFGLYFPLAVNDEVEVTAPSGDPAEGIVVSKRLWSASDVPPQAVSDNPQDAILVVQPGANLRIYVSDGGTVQFNGSSDAMALASLVKADLDKLQETFDTHVHSGVFPGASLTAVPTVPVGPLPDIASSVVLAGE